MPISDNSPRSGGRRARPSRRESDQVREIIGSATGLRQGFPTLIPRKPYCADRLDEGLQIRPKAAALRKRHIQLNGPASFQWLVQDIDRPDAYLAHSDALLPPPNVIMINPSNGHAHSAYLMASPIARHSMARLKPLRFYAAVERGIARRLEADRAYTALIAKNPVHRDWKVEWRRDEPYTLTELEGWLWKCDMRPDPTPRATWGAGRNVTVFDELRALAYREVRKFKRDGESFTTWLDRCLKIALALNGQFPQPLKLSECRAIAKSVAKWTWKHFSVEKFLARQRHLSKLGHAKRWGSMSAARLKPWKTLGISRATYYRRKRGGLL